MNADEINYRVLRKIQEMGKRSPVLTRIEPSFYNDLSEYLENLNDRLKKESSSQKQMLLKGEIQDTKKIVRNVYEQREKKILLATISKARGGNPNLSNLVDVERNLFDSILALMMQSRKQVLDIQLKEKTKKEKKVKSKNENMKNERQENSKPIVMITQSIPTFIGTDMKEYNLRHGDVLTLPEDMSKMLSKKGAARKIV